MSIECETWYPGIPAPPVRPTKQVIKQVIVMRHKYVNSKGETFSLRKGKMIAQACHASMSFLTKKLQPIINKTAYSMNLSLEEQQWIQGSFAKVCVRVNSEEELLEVYKKAQDAGLEVHLITDSGKTEFHGEPTHTCLAIGPDNEEKIDKITGHLELL